MVFAKKWVVSDGFRQKVGGFGCFGSFGVILARFAVFHVLVCILFHGV